MTLNIARSTDINNSNTVMTCTITDTQVYTLMTYTVSQSRYMHTDPQIHYNITLVLDMHARHRYYKAQSTTVPTYISATQAYGYTDTVVHCT